MHLLLAWTLTALFAFGLLMGCGHSEEATTEGADDNDRDEDASLHVPGDGYVGQRLDETVTREELQAEYDAGVVRVYRRGDAITTDYIPDRLNVEVDADGRILALWMDHEGGPFEGEDHEDHADPQPDPRNDAPDDDDNDATKPTGAQLTERFAGQHLGTDVSEAEIRQASQAVVLRVHGYGDPVTMDYAEGRVNIALDDDGRIKAIWRDEEGYPRE